jgi:hypothetical protein
MPGGPIPRQIARKKVPDILVEGATLALNSSSAAVQQPDGHTPLSAASTVVSFLQRPPSTSLALALAGPDVAVRPSATT